MKVAAILASAMVLLAYVRLMRADPAFGLTHPRGGMLVLAISLGIANVGVWMATQADRPLATRFQLAVAAWIWLAVQGGSIVYLHASAA